MREPSQSAERKPCPPAAEGRPSARALDWAQAFSPPVRDAVEAWLNEHPDTAVLGPWDDLAAFRLDPVNLIRRVEQRLSAGTAGTDAVVCLLPSAGPHGLDENEAKAVLEEWLATDLLASVDIGLPSGRILAAGRIRRTIAGLAFRLEARGRVSPGRLWSLVLRRLLSRTPVAVLFLDRDTARNLLDSGRGIHAFFLRRIGAALGLWIPKERTQGALADLVGEREPLDELTSGVLPVSVVAFEDTSALNPPDRLAQAMKSARIGIDCSLEHGAPRPIAGTMALDGAYAACGAYRIQPFDLRLANPMAVEGDPVELVRRRLSASGHESALSDTLDQDRIRRIAQLGRLLDFREMERFFRTLEEDPTVNRRYHEARVYNWPGRGPTPALTLIDCGSVDATDHASVLLGAARRASCTAWPPVTFANGTEFIGHVMNSVSARNPGRRSVLRQQQLAGHGYLASVPADASLREDLAAFVAFVPAKLADALEVGSGYGRMARELAPRSRSYTCIDLSLPMISALHGPDLRGVVADAHRLPFGDCTFDTVLANNSLEHLHSPLDALVEIRRILRPGGRLLALIPLDALNPEHELPTHLWKADEISIRSALAMADFTVRRCETLDLGVLGVDGAFPTCLGLVCQVDAQAGAGTGAA